MLNLEIGPGPRSTASRAITASKSSSSRPAIPSAASRSSAASCAPKARSISRARTWQGDLDAGRGDLPGRRRDVDPARRPRCWARNSSAQRHCACARPTTRASASRANISARPLSWRVIYSAQDWPLKRLLNTLLGWREFDGRLQASGWAEQAPGQDWVGGTHAAAGRPVVRRAAQQVPHRAHPARQRSARPVRRTRRDSRRREFGRGRIDQCRRRGVRRRGSSEISSRRRCAAEFAAGPKRSRCCR